MNQRDEPQATSDSRVLRAAMAIVLVVALACAAILLVPLPSGGATPSSGTLVGSTAQLDQSFGPTP